MTEAPIDKVIARIEAVYKSWSRTTPLESMRRDWDELFASDSAPAQLQPVSAGGVDAAWISAPGVREDKVVIYFHGGGFQVGSVRSHRALIACLSAASGCRMLGVDYRRAPEYRFPAPVLDACAAYECVLAEGIQPSDVAFAGDSAGAGLALSALLSLRERARPLPAAVVLMSAWTDLTAFGRSYETRAKSDPIHQRPMILAMAKKYLGESGDPRDPLASPLFADLTGLPPMLIQVGDRETVLDDSRNLAEKARAAGVRAELQVWDHMIHVFQQFPCELPEAREAIRSAGAFLRNHLAMGQT